MRAGWLVLSLATFTLAAATPLACGKPFILDTSPVGASSSTGMGGEAASGGAGPGGGNGGSSNCEQDGDCAGPNGACVQQKCEDKVCVTKFVPADEEGSSQIYGDCQVITCDGKGNPVPKGASEDFYDDGSSCSVDKCVDGAAKNEPVMGMMCGRLGPKMAFCDANGACVECLGPSQCTSPQICSVGKCMPPTCVNNTKDGDESAKDCGGSCLPCLTGAACKGFKDCASGICEGQVCSVATCTDHVKNGVETDVDCGGTSCSECLANYICKLGTDCTSHVCKAGLCQASSCTDGLQNGEETGIDCGGPCGNCG